MKYKVLTATTVGGIENLVNARIKAGWVPLGGVCYVGGAGFMQAMISSEAEQ